MLKKKTRETRLKDKRQRGRKKNYCYQFYWPVTTFKETNKNTTNNCDLKNKKENLRLNTNLLENISPTYNIFEHSIYLPFLSS